MTGINIVIKLSIVVFVIFTSAITPCSSVISDKRLCFDPKCLVPVSEAFTLMDYHSNDRAIMSFKSNTNVKVYSKSAGNREDLWGVEINGKRGYVPSRMIQERRILRKQLLHVVPTELTIESDTQSVKDVPKTSENPDPKASNVSPESEVPETLKVKNNTEELGTKTSPEPSRISPSFEIHDGTTLPVAMNEEPQEPSYSTLAPGNPAEIEQHPILSVHPNIASTITQQMQEKSVASVDNAIEKGKYSDLEGVKEIELKKTEDRSKPESNRTEEISGDEAASKEAISLEKEETANPVDSPLDPGLLSSQVEPPEITGIDRKESSTENAAGVNSIASNITDSNGEESDGSETEADSDEEIAEGEVASEGEEEEKETSKTSTKPDEEKNPEIAPEPQQAVEKSSVETLENLSEEKLETKIPEHAERSETPESPDNDTRIEKSKTDDVKSVQNNEIVKLPEISENEKERVEISINTTEDAAIAPDVSENSKIEVEAVENAVGESENTNSTEDPILQAGEESAGNSIQEKSTEDVPLNLNIMNPLFNRLSMLPSIVKNVIDSTILSNEDGKTKSEHDSNEEKPETKNTHEEIDSNKSISENDKSADNNHKNDIDDSIPATVPSENPEPESGIVQNSNQEKIVNIDDNNNNLVNEIEKNDNTADSTVTSPDLVSDNSAQPGIYKEDELSGLRQEKITVDETPSFNGFPKNRNLLNVGNGLYPDDHKSAGESVKVSDTENSVESKVEEADNEALINSESNGQVPEDNTTPETNLNDQEDAVTETADSCLVENTCQKPESLEENLSSVREVEDDPVEREIEMIDVAPSGRNYWETLTYLVVTGLTTLLFSLGYYYIENTRRDGQYIAKINQLEKQLLVCSKECTMLDDTLKSTKTKLDSIEDESFGSNEMVASLKADLEASKLARSELEDQVGMLEKELESATEAGLELERMLREILSTNNEENPLAQSVEDLQERLNAQQAANEALTNAFNLKAQENETLTAELKAMTLKSEQLEVEVTRVTADLKHQNDLKSNLEQTLLEKVEHLEKQVKDISAERINLRKQLKGKEMEMKDLLDVVNQMNINNLDFDKLYNVSRVKAEASQLLEERDDLKIRLSEVEGAHQLLEEHVKLINEEVSSLSEQCKLAEKAKREAETKVEVLSNFFKEKEAQRQKEEAVWLQQQGEVSSTVERLHTMQNEIHNYKQQIEILKREILDQEREYKNQISSLETKSHENWVMARQNERRLEESKAEAGQLRNRLTLIEKNLNDIDPEAKLHRLEVNGETATSPPLFIGAEASSSPIMFTGSSGVPLPPPPSYLYGPPVPPFMPPPPHSSSGIGSYEVGQRPPPLGGRLSSPPPLHSTNSGRYENRRSPPPPLSPSMIPPYGPPHRAYPPPPFPNERIHLPPPPHSTHLPPPLGNASSHNWGDETLPPPPLRSSGFIQAHHQQTQAQHHHHHPHHRDNQPRARNHKGSLHSSGESLDKNL